jgi:hypothetical protein
VPAFPFLFSQIDSFAGHYRRYTRKFLRVIIPSSLHTSLHTVKMIYFNPIGGIGWWLDRFIKKKSIDDAIYAAEIRIFDKYIIPFSKILQPLTQHIFGQSLVCIMKKV